MKTRDQAYLEGVLEVARLYGFAMGFQVACEEADADPKEVSLAAVRLCGLRDSLFLVERDSTLERVQHQQRMREMAEPKEQTFILITDNTSPPEALSHAA
jgi:hypothetical protein